MAAFLFVAVTERKVVMSEAKSEEKGGDGEGKEQSEGKDGVVDDEAEAKGERDDRVGIDQATVSLRARSTTRPASPAAAPHQHQHPLHTRPILTI